MFSTACFLLSLINFGLNYSSAIFHKAWKELERLLELSHGRRFIPKQTHSYTWLHCCSGWAGQRSAWPTATEKGEKAFTPFPSPLYISCHLLPDPHWKPSSGEAAPQHVSIIWMIIWNSSLNHFLVEQKYLHLRCGSGTSSCCFTYSLHRPLNLIKQLEKMEKKWNKNGNH